MNWNAFKTQVKENFRPQNIIPRVLAGPLAGVPEVAKGVAKVINHFAPGPPTPRPYAQGFGQKKSNYNFPMPKQNVVPPPPPVVTENAYNPMYQKFIANVGRDNPQQSVPPPTDLQKGIMAASKKYKIPPELLYSIAHQETGFQNIAEHGGGNGRGYFQIDLGYHPDVTEQQAMDPMFASDYAGGMIDQRLNRYSKTPTPVSNAIRAYNGGITNPRTLKYLQGVQGKLKQFQWE